MKRRLRIGIIDIVSTGPTRAMYARVMNANLCSIMPQVTGVWCAEEGHDVSYVCYTGFEDLMNEIPPGVDLVFLSAFTEAAHTAYALSNMFRHKGAVTVLGGPHARAYPQDAVKYFDYVLGFTDRETLRAVLQDCEQHRPIGRHVSAGGQPKALPGVRERWPFIEATLRKSPLIKVVPMLASLGCPYTCSFCIDAKVPHQPLDLDVMQEDLRFLLTKFKRPLVGWHDPNFGVRFDEVMDAIEEAIPPGGIDFIAESTLSILSEPNMKRLERNGFKALLPGIESWYELGNKSKTGARHGMEKVEHVADQINMILRYVPYLQANFVLGMDVDEGSEPFELTRRFLDRCPGAFPAYSLISAFGESSPLNLEYQEADRVLPFPFHFVNNNKAMNVRPKNYSWRAFYDELIGLTSYSFSWRSIWKRFKATKGLTSRWMNVVRAVSSEGFGRIRYHKNIRRRLDTDPQFSPYFEQETTVLPAFYVDVVRKDLGALWEWLPEGGLHHDPNAYLKSQPSARSETGHDDDRQRSADGRDRAAAQPSAEQAVEEGCRGQAPGILGLIVARNRRPAQGDPGSLDGSGPPGCGAAMPSRQSGPITGR